MNKNQTISKTYLFESPPHSLLINQRKESAMQTENEKAVRDPIAEAIDLLEKSAEPFDKACMLLRAALQSQSNTDGWVMVPVEPTFEMQSAIIESVLEDADSVSAWAVYKAMLAAAPKAPQQVSNTPQDGWKALPVRNIEAAFHPCEFQVTVGFKSCRAASEFMAALKAPPQQQEQSGEAVSAADAFELGFQFANALQSPMSGETRHIARIMTADFWPAGFSECAKGIDYTGTASAAIVHVKRNIISKLSTFPATPIVTASQESAPTSDQTGREPT
jgi:hypothetical protein